MSPEAQRIAIAEACGWKFVINPVTRIGGYWEQGQQGTEGYRRGDWGSRECLVGLPNYLSDLNAMHEAEKVLTAEHHNKYVKELAEVVYNDWERRNNDLVFNHCTATATQRAEAFLRTLNLWKEDEK